MKAEILSPSHAAVCWYLGTCGTVYLIKHFLQTPVIPSAQQHGVSRGAFKEPEFPGFDGC